MSPEPRLAMEFTAEEAAEIALALSTIPGHSALSVSRWLMLDQFARMHIADYPKWVAEAEIHWPVDLRMAFASLAGERAPVRAKRLGRFERFGRRLRRFIRGR